MALAACLTGTVSYYLAARGRERFLSLARLSYHYFTALIISACALLLYYFLAGDYSFKYVFEYSSSDLPLFYLISAFWAGQQGTYLLWLAFLALIGYYLVFRAGRYMPYGMFFYGLINLFFCTVLLVLSPFEKLPIAQSEGAGLNPLLIDPWMVIHPPVMFIGYAAAAVPYVIALAALVKNDFKDWLRVVFVPVAMVSVTLAAGNIMGGFWAYKTLGWGGYWAWDPVENSSFVPWMISLALIHGLLLERQIGALRRTNLFLALLTFILAVYGTFLTRSGVLADFSVHSFVDLGVNNLLVSFLVVTVIAAVVALGWRYRQIKGPAVSLAISSRQFALLFSVWVLSFIGLIVLSGMSWPLLTDIFGAAGAVDTAVYTRIIFPLAILMAVFLGFAPVMAWQGNGLGKVARKNIPAFVGAFIAAVIGYVLGVRGMVDILYVFAVGLTLMANVIALWRLLPGKWIQAGSHLAHLGLALMLIGILASSAFGFSGKVVIDRHATGTALGLDIRYLGVTEDIQSPNNEIILKVTDSLESYDARPKIYWSERSQGLMRKPFIKRHLLYDLYFAPEQIEDLGGENGIILSRGQPDSIGPYLVTFREFKTEPHAAGTSMRFGAVLEISDSLGRTNTITPAMVFETGQDRRFEDTGIRPGLDDRSVRLEQIFADRGAVRLTVEGLTPQSSPDRLIMEVMKKPAMNVLWAGAVLVVIGGLLSLGRRWNLPADS